MAITFWRNSGSGSRRARHGVSNRWLVTWGGPDNYRAAPRRRQDRVGRALER